MDETMGIVLMQELIVRWENNMMGEYCEAQMVAILFEKWIKIRMPKT